MNEPTINNCPRDRISFSPPTCTDETGSYNQGESWECPDGCNTCTCDESGEIISTDLACEETCTDTTGTYDIGESWLCPDGCNTCGCLEGGVITSTEMACP